MNNAASKQELLTAIQQLSFYAVDLNLFLDTHPENIQALQDYGFVSSQLKQLRELYNRQYGPLLGFGESLSMTNTWTWASDTEKWPWEGNEEV